jgi:heme/copper-type cytochrome/quinol oxidase subunit 2
VIRTASRKTAVRPALLLLAAGWTSVGMTSSALASLPATLGQYPTFTATAPAALAWAQWWLPPNYSVHGGAIDSLFLWIFWITLIVFIAVQATIVYFLIKYRDTNRPKAHFTHGNTRLEMAWTIAPAIILAGLAIGSKAVWDEYRYGLSSEGEEPATLLVIGEQFQWNVIYPGPSGRLGRYLQYPKPTDLTWPSATGQPLRFAGVPGPAHLPREQAIGAINDFIAQPQYRLGKDFTDPNGADDDWQRPFGEVIVPVDQPIEVHLTSMDVIHSFFLPHFRVKLDAVPGMRGIVRFTAVGDRIEEDKKLLRAYQLDELDQIVQRHEMLAVLGPQDEARGAEHSAVRPRTPRIWRFVDEQGTIARQGTILTSEVLERLRASGVQEIRAHGYYDLVCAELCGLGHSLMQGRLILASQDEYRQLFESP